MTAHGFALIKKKTPGKPGVRIFILQSSYLLDTGSAYGPAHIISDPVFFFAEDAALFIFFENDPTLFCENFDRVTVFNSKLVSKLYGDYKASEFVDITYNAYIFHTGLLTCVLGLVAEIEPVKELFIRDLVGYAISNMRPYGTCSGIQYDVGHN